MRENELKKYGYKIVSIWESEFIKKERNEYPKNLRT